MNQRVVKARDCTVEYLYNWAHLQKGDLLGQLRVFMEVTYISFVMRDCLVYLCVLLLCVCVLGRGGDEAQFRVFTEVWLPFWWCVDECCTEWLTECFYRNAFSFVVCLCSRMPDAALFENPFCVAGQLLTLETLFALMSNTKIVKEALVKGVSTFLGNGFLNHICFRLFSQVRLCWNKPVWLTGPWML